MLSVRRWRRAALAGSAASALYAAVLLAWSLRPSSEIALSTPLWLTIGGALAGAVGAVGVPIALRIHYRVWSPVALMAGVLLFWHVLIEYPPIGSGQGDTPGFTFVLLFAPLYVAGYLLLAAVERWLRGQTGLELPLA
jgi:hypothetical protein